MPSFVLSLLVYVLSIQTIVHNFCYNNHLSLIIIIDNGLKNGFKKMKSKKTLSISV